MIDPAQLAICRQRGHATTLEGERKWTKCKWCGMWIREVATTTVEEREDEPPANEQSMFARNQLKQQ